MSTLMPGLHILRAPLLGVLLLSGYSLHAQPRPPLVESTVQLPDAPSSVAAPFDLPKQSDFPHNSLALSFSPSQGQGQLWTGWFLDPTNLNRLRPHSLALLRQSTGKADAWAREPYFLGSIRVNWTTLGPNSGALSSGTIRAANDWERYGYHIPWAGPIVLRVGQEARAHPRLTALLRVVQPQF